MTPSRQLLSGIVAVFLIVASAAAAPTESIDTGAQGETDPAADTQPGAKVGVVDDAAAAEHALGITHTPGGPRIPNTVIPEVDPQVKKDFYKTMVANLPFTLHDMFNLMAFKRKVNDGVSWDDAVAAIESKAVEVNLKVIGHNRIWREVAAKTGDEDTPKIEIFQYCDALVARKILDYAPEFSVFLPCRIILLEDNDRNLWVMTMDWDVEWVRQAVNPDSQLAEDLLADAQRIHDGMWAIMDAAVNGDW